MSGLATIAAVVGATAAVGSTAYGVYSGQQQQGMQQQALKKQNTAQQTATSASLNNERNSEIAQGAANKKTPDITSILQRAASGAKGVGGTMLTGPGGVDSSGLNLGGATLLGS